MSPNTADQTAIEKVLSTYGDALNAGDVAKIVSLYAADCAVIPQGGPTATGLAEVKATYEHFFQLVKFDIKFQLDEVVVSGDYAFARTHSAGTTRDQDSGKTAPEGNRELYVLQKVNREWKLARYIFNENVPK